MSGVFANRSRFIASRPVRLHRAVQVTFHVFNARVELPLDAVARWQVLVQVFCVLSDETFEEEEEFLAAFV